MRISDVLPLIVVGGVGLAAAQPLPFDGTITVQLDVPAQTITMEELRAGAQRFKFGDKAKAIQGLIDAAEKGNAFALWRLGRMYADGDGLEQNHLKAFELFSRCADDHAFDSPDMPQSHFVANAYVALGRYYLDGIANSHVKADPERARDMFAYAASYFGDSDAQYQLGRLYFEGKGKIARDPRQAVRWLSLAANKGQYEAQALLGKILFSGDSVPRQRSLGLMWLTVARDGPGAKVKWINELHDSALTQASDAERASALALIERWLEGRREYE
jgi:TPR repeat protein